MKSAQRRNARAEPPVRVVEYGELAHEASAARGRRPSVAAAPVWRNARRERLERAVREILSAIGEDPDREGLRETPARVARLYEELFSGLTADPAAILSKSLHEPYAGTVLLRDIPLVSVCEHHLLPFAGLVHVAYAPGKKLVGLSKLVRLVDALARRPQVQERLTEQIAAAIMRHLGARGAAVRVQAVHGCMTVRGVRKPGTSVVTTALHGCFRDDPAARAEALALFGGSARLPAAGL
jgi:GTP cyclohydrolase I